MADLMKAAKENFPTNVLITLVIGLVIGYFVGGYVSGGATGQAFTTSSARVCDGNIVKSTFALDCSQSGLVCKNGACVKPTTTLPCTDSDNSPDYISIDYMTSIHSDYSKNKDIYVKGTVCGDIHGTGQYGCYDDSCRAGGNGVALQEGFCDSKGRSANLGAQCPSGKCSNGACVK